MKNYPFKIFRHVQQAFARSLAGTMVVALCGQALPSHASVLEDDTWVNSRRNVQNLPTESAWWASSTASLVANFNSMTGTVQPTNAALWLTYFTTLPAAPATLFVGDTLKVTMVFTPSNVATGTPPTSRGLRIGLFNYAAGGNRVLGDTFSASDANGANVQGYLLEMNFVQSFTTIPLRINKRTGTADDNLMGAIGDYTTLGTGGGNAGDPGFTNGTQYTLELSVTRLAADTVAITTRVFGPNLDIWYGVTDTSATTYAFDCFALRPARADSSADTFKITRFKVEKQIDVKWDQPPVTTQPTNVFYGWNELSMYGQDPVIADDWACTTPNPVTAIRWWGSFINWCSNTPPPGAATMFQISFWNDIPATNNQPSHPATNWLGHFYSTNFTCTFAGWDYDPRSNIYEACFEFDMPLDPVNWFYQVPGNGTNIYWINIAAMPGYPWGWKTRPRITNSLAPDDAVRFWWWTVNPPSYQAIYWPAVSNSWDMAFELISGGGSTSNIVSKWEQLPDLSTNGMDVNDTMFTTQPPPYYLLADDFICNSTGPITNITIWGSWFHDYHDGGLMPSNVTFTLSIHDDIAASNNPNGTYSMPGSVKKIWTFGPGQYSCSIYASNIYEGWLNPPADYNSMGDFTCYQYDFNIPTNAFVQTNGTTYWLDVQAQMPAIGQVKFGWKTSISHSNDAAVWANATEPWAGLWSKLVYPPGHPYYKGGTNNIDLAFRLNGTAGTVPPKWSQRPQSYTPANWYNGWDQPSIDGQNFVADDWVCTNATPVTDIHWWGSFLNWQSTNTPPQLPDAFWIRFYNDVPKQVDGFSHPSNLVWQVYCTNSICSFAGWDLDPRTTNGALDACFEFYQVLTPDKWFTQPPGTNTYWLSIAAVYNSGQSTYSFGWKTRPRDPNSLAPDDAVFWIPTGSPPWYPIFWPNPSNSWDMAFALTMGGQSNCIEVVCSTNILVTCAPTNGAVVHFQYYATNHCTGEGNLPVTCWPTNGSLFPVGITTVCCTNITPPWTNSCCFTVTVHSDTTPPAITCWTNIVANTDPGQCSKSNVTFVVTATDDCDTNPLVVCNPVSGSTFLKGTNTVNCTATDASGNSNSCSFTVTIRDRELPSIQCPSNIVANADSGQNSKSNVTYSVIVSDNCPGVTTNCNPPSGSTFLIGTNTVCCTATDTSGNTNMCCFAVTIFPPRPSTNIVITNIVFNSKFNGWNEPSVYGSTNIAADDWVCTTTNPVTDIRWWGSFQNWQSNTPPTLTNVFHFTIWSDVPKQGTNFSHPNQVLWETDCTNTTCQFVGWDVDPQTLAYEACFRFDQRLATGTWFYQTNGLTGTNIYWLSIAAVYAQGQQPQYAWGWKTRPRQTNSLAPDDAVRISSPTSPHTNINNYYVSGGPIYWPTSSSSWDLAFELISSYTNPATKWQQPPDLTTTGMDVDDTSYGIPIPPPYLLADDFQCTNTGPLTDITIWGSWTNNYETPGNLVFTLSIHKDVPAQGVTNSMPGQLLWTQTFAPGQYQYQWVPIQVTEGWLTPPVNYIFPGDNACFQCDFHVANNAFVQTNGNIYWLDVQAQLPQPGGQASVPAFGWKTASPQNHFNDDAVWVNAVEPYAGNAWKDLHYPPQHPYFPQSIDLAFGLTTSQSYYQLKWSQPPVTNRYVMIEWTCENYVHYQLLATTNLMPVVTWTNVGPELIGPVHQQSDTNTTAPQRFYRVLAP
jgi:hypothetical protein